MHVYLAHKTAKEREDRVFHLFRPLDGKLYGGLQRDDHPFTCNLLMKQQTVKQLNKKETVTAESRASSLPSSSLYHGRVTKKYATSTTVQNPVASRKFHRNSSIWCVSCIVSSSSV